VLAGGGARAAYQVGVLHGIAERAPHVRFPIVTGVSAGAINAGGLASGEGTLLDSVERLERAWRSISLRDVFDPTLLSIGGSLARWGYMVLTRGSASLFEARSILDTRPLKRTLTRYVDEEALQRNVAAGRLTALGITTTDYSNGRTVTFVQGLHDEAAWERAGRVGLAAEVTPDHVLASSALPLVFPAVEIGGRHYGDGSIRQTAPLAPAIHLGAERLFVISIRHADWKRATGTPFRGYPPAAQVAGMLFNAVFMDAMEADIERLQRVNRTLEAFPANVPHPERLRVIDLQVMQPSRDLGRIAAENVDALPTTLRYILRGLGAHELSQSDLLSYLLFEPPYIRRLLELGRADLHAQWDRLGPWFGEI